MNSLNLKFQFDCIPCASHTSGCNATAELKSARALGEPAPPSHSRHKDLSVLVVLLAIAASTPVISFAQCASLSGNWIASTQSGKRLTLQIQQLPNSCHLNGSLYVENWHGVINGDVSGNDVRINVTSDDHTWYLKGNARPDGIVFAKWKGDP